MKALLLLVATLPLVASAEIDSTNSDKRAVGNTTVDLAPVNQWFKSRSGERPMKHWKRLVITEVQDRAGSGWRCSAAVDGGENVTIYIMNLPEPVRAYVQGVYDLHARIQSLETQLADDKTNRKAAYARYVNTSVDTSAVYSSKRGVVADTDATRGQTVAAFDQRIEEAENQLNTLHDEYRQAMSQASKKAVTLAMFNGNKFGGVEVWDCGRPVR